MASEADPISNEASTATVTRLCLEQFQQCIQQLEGQDKITVQTRLADLRLWADSVGATAQAKAALDWRFQHRTNDIRFIRDLLSMLESFLKECSIAVNNRSDIQDIITNINSTVDSLAFIGVQIRHSGHKSRLRKADDSFDQNQDKYRKLRAHLNCVVTSKPTEDGRPKDEGKEIHSFDYFADIKLPPIQERLVKANLRRRHRFTVAQNHSHALKDHSTKTTIIPSKLFTKEVSPMQNKEVAAAVQQKQERPADSAKDAYTIPTTSASGLDSKWDGLHSKRQPGSTVTRITSITASIRYPKVNSSPYNDQKLVKCPCCCQAIPAIELEDSQWRKHVANDICPYTCILENCPTPYNLFVSQKEWNDHFMSDHPPQWQCPCCEDDPPVFKSLSGITSHMVSKHVDEVSWGLEDLLSEAEIKVMGITKCPLCDSDGPQDSPDLVEHVLQHVHDFSLRSLPWPMDPSLSLDKPVGIFDMSRASKKFKDGKGNTYVFDIAGWAETVVPTFDVDRGVKIVYDSKGNELALEIPGWPENTTLESPVSLQLRDMDRNPPKASKTESIPTAAPDNGYFSQNDYFVDDSSGGRSSSQTSHSSQQTDGSVRSSRRQQPKKWACTLCSLRGDGGGDAYFWHLDNLHPEHIEKGKELFDGDVEQWKRSMLDEAYWNGVEVISATLSAESSPSSENLTSYEVYSIRKVQPVGKEKSTWAKVSITKEPLTQDDIAVLLKKLQASSQAVSDKKAALYPFQQTQVNRLLDELNTEEMDPNFTWSLSQLDRREKTTNKVRETVLISVVVKRCVREDVEAGVVYAAIERNKHERAVAMNRPPPPPIQQEGSPPPMIPPLMNGPGNPNQHGPPPPNNPYGPPGRPLPNYRPPSNSRRPSNRRQRRSGFSSDLDSISDIGSNTDSSG